MSNIFYAVPLKLTKLIYTKFTKGLFRALADSTRSELAKSYAASRPFRAPAYGSV